MAVSFGAVAMTTACRVDLAKTLTPSGFFVKIWLTYCKTPFNSFGLPFCYLKGVCYVMPVSTDYARQGPNKK
jgi:hypothetical protein